MSLKKFDRDSDIFKSAMMLLLMDRQSKLSVISHIIEACEKAWKQSGEVGDMPEEVGRHVDVKHICESLVDATLSFREGVPMEECDREVQIEFASDARKAVTAHLAQRVTA